MCYSAAWFNKAGRLLCLFAMGLGVGIVEGGEEMGPLVDALTQQPVSRKLLESSKAYGLVVHEVMKDGRADKAGIQVGDTLLAADGFRFYEPEEYAFLRMKFLGRREMDLVYNHDGEIKHVKITGLGIKRSLEFIHIPENPAHAPLMEELKRLGQKYDEEKEKLLRHYPARALAAYEEWRAAAGQDAPAPWFTENVAMYLALLKQDYHDFGPAKQAPVPFINQLSDFYRAISAKYRAGAHVPDWNAYGAISRDFWALYYPCPPFEVIGEKTRLKLTDKAFLRAIEGRQWSQPSADQRQVAWGLIHQPASVPIEGYLAGVKGLLLSRDARPHWFQLHRHSQSLDDPTIRTQLQGELAALVEKEHELRGSVNDSGQADRLPAHQSAAESFVDRWSIINSIGKWLATDDRSALRLSRQK